jgi:hypothetical protein
MKNLAMAVISVMKEVKGMEKNSKVGDGKMQYNGTKDQDVKEVFNEALAKYGLCILPTSIDPKVQIDRWIEDTQYGPKSKQSVFTEVATKYMLLHESGEHIELAGYGQGVDSQDKGAGKASTYALKNCLLYTFLTPVGKIDDTDITHSETIAAPPIKKEYPQNDLPWVNEAQIDKMIVRIKSGETDVIVNAKAAFKISKANMDKLINANK